MTPGSVSAVLEKLIHRLCLGDFPCGCVGLCVNVAERQGEEEEALLDLLRCPHSPWFRDHPWSPQAASLRELAARAPGRLRANFVRAHFTALRLAGKDVALIDEGLLKFSNLEELVLSANNITEIPAENLPNTLEVLELRSNRLCSLDGLVRRPLPRLQYLGLASNALGSCRDFSHFTGRHWPRLVCLDLGDCEFQDQRALLDSLSTLPRLRTLVLEGNPFTLAACYPGWALDRLPKLLYLDSACISPQDRDCFRGLAQMSGLSFDWTVAVVTVGRLKGVPHPLMDTVKRTSDHPVSAYSYYVTYDFFSRPTPPSTVGDPDSAAAKDAAPESTPNKSDSMASADVGRCNNPNLCVTDMNSPEMSTCSTSKVTWSEGMDFGDTQAYAVCDLDGFKRFCHRGLDLSVVEEKALVKPGTTRDKRKNRSAQQPLQDGPSRRVLGSARVPLRSLLKRPQKVHVLCDFGVLGGESEAEATRPGSVTRVDPDQCRVYDSIQEEKEGPGESGRGEGSSVLSGESEETEPRLQRSEPATLELSVELKKWTSAAEARQLSP